MFLFYLFSRTEAWCCKEAKYNGQIYERRSSYTSSYLRDGWGRSTSYGYEPDDCNNISACTEWESECGADTDEKICYTKDGGWCAGSTTASAAAEKLCCVDVTYSGVSYSTLNLPATSTTK
jgi:hypothetical protein